MNRNDLTPGTDYAYRSGKYDSVVKVRVITTEACHRVASNHYGSGFSASANKDGIRVGLVEGTFHYFSVRNISDHAYHQAEVDKAEGKVYGVHSTLALYDGWVADTDDPDGEDSLEVFRVLPRYIFSTWDDYIAEKEASKVRRSDEQDRKVALMDRMEALHESLPEEFKDLIEFTRYSDLSGRGLSVSDYKVERLAEAIIEAFAQTVDTCDGFGPQTEEAVA